MLIEIFWFVILNTRKIFHKMFVIFIFFLLCLDFDFQSNQDAPICKSTVF